MDTSSASPDQSIHVYRWPWRWRLLVLAGAGVRLLAVSAAIALFAIILSWMLEDGDGAFLRSPFPAVTGLILLLFAGLWLVYAAHLIGGLFLTSLSLSPGGLEYRSWPGTGVRCAWPAVEHLGPHAPPGLPLSHVLFLKDGETFGWPAGMAWRRRLGLDTQFIVPLTGLPGWPDGAVAADLRQYAPRLFERPPGMV